MIDTLQVSKALLLANFTQEQAEAVAELAKDVTIITSEEAAAQLGKFAAKSELEDLATKADIAELRGELETKLEKLNGDLRSEIGSLRSEIRESQNTIIKWMVGTMIAWGGIILGFLTFALKH